MAATVKHLNSAVLDGGLTYLRSNALSLHVVRNYVLASTYSNVTSPVSGGAGGLSLGSVSCTSSNISAPATGTGTSPAVTRLVTVTPPSTITVAAGNTANGTTDELGLVLVSGSIILASTDLTPDSAIAAGNILSIAPFTITFNQPT